MRKFLIKERIFKKKQKGRKENKVSLRPKINRQSILRERTASIKGRSFPSFFN